MGPPGRLHDVPAAAPPRVCYGGASTDGRYCERTKRGNIFITSTEDAELFGHLAVTSSTLTKQTISIQLTFLILYLYP